VGVIDTLRSVLRFERLELDADLRRLRRAASVADLRAIAKRRLPDRKSTRLNSSHMPKSRMPSSA